MKRKWPTVPLGEMLTERRETPPDEAILSGKIPIIAKIGFNDGKIELREDGKTRTKMILIRPGDLVISGINATKGESIFAICGGFSAASLLEASWSSTFLAE